MKRDLLYLLFFLIVIQSGFSQTAQQLQDFKESSPLFTSKYYKENVWDAFRTPAKPIPNTEWHLYYFKTAYDATTRRAIDWGTGRYLMFDLIEDISGAYTDDVFNSGSSYTIILKLYESNGTFVKNICSYGLLMGFGDKGFVFEQDGYYGTFFANDSYTVNGEVKYTPTTGLLTKLSQLRNYNYSPQLLKPAVSTTKFEYNGQQQGITIAANAGYTITGTVNAIEIGIYTVVVKLVEGNTWSDGTDEDITINWSIERGNYNMSEAKWNYTEPFKYDGKVKTVTVIGLPEGVRASNYFGNSGTKPGDYQAIVELAYDEQHYNQPTMQPLFWKIANDIKIVARPTISNTTFTYNGSEQGINLTSTDNYTVSGDVTGVAVGEYTVRVSLKDKVGCKWDNQTTTDLTFGWNIAKATYDMKAAHWDYVSPFIMDGSTKTVLLTELPEGVTVKNYTGNSAMSVGEYTASAELNYDAANFFAPQIAPLQWEIKAAYNNLTVIKLWNNVLAVSNGDKYDEIRSATYSWYKDGVRLNGNKQYIRFEGSIPVANYKVEIVVNEAMVAELFYTVTTTSGIKAYPNPVMAGRTLTLDMNNQINDDEKIEIFNLTGALVKASVAKENLGYKISGLTTPGTYILKVSSSNGTTNTVKIVVK